MSICCNGGLLNSGVDPCVETIGKIKGLIVQSKYGASGARNSIDLTATFGATQVQALVQNAVQEARWIPWTDFKNVDLPIGDTVFETAGNQEKDFVDQGLRSFVGELWTKKAHHVIGGLLKRMRCTEFVVFLVTEDNQLVGSVDGYTDGLPTGGLMYGIDVNAQSFDPKYMFKTDTATNKIMWAFDFKKPFKEENLYVLNGANLSTPVNFLELVGLRDVRLNVSNIVDGASLTFDVNVASLFAGGLLPNGNVTGLTASNFALYNETSAAAITPITVTGGSVLGEPYSFDCASQTASDVIRLSMVTTTGFEGVVTFVHP